MLLLLSTLVSQSINLASLQSSDAKQFVKRWRPQLSIETNGIKIFSPSYVADLDVYVKAVIILNDGCSAFLQLEGDSLNMFIHNEHCLKLCLWGKTRREKSDYFRMLRKWHSSVFKDVFLDCSVLEEEDQHMWDKSKDNFL